MTAHADRPPGAPSGGDDGAGAMSTLLEVGRAVGRASKIMIAVMGAASLCIAILVVFCVALVWIGVPAPLAPFVVVGLLVWGFVFAMDLSERLESRRWHARRRAAGATGGGGDES